MTKLGLFQDKALLATWVVTTPESTTVSEVQSILMAFESSLSFAGASAMVSDAITNVTTINAALPKGDERNEVGLAVPAPSDSIIASVVPTLTDKWASALHQKCGTQPLVVGPGVKTGIKLGYSDPSEIGADRIADAVAARSMFSGPLIVINLEATTTFEVINDKGEFAGGLIAPGLEASLTELSHVAAKIPVIEVEAPAHVIAKTTREAVQAGAVLGEAARIDGLVSKIWDELGYKTKVIAAGAHAKLIQSLSQTIDQCVDNLTLQGLNLLYLKNRG